MSVDDDSAGRDVNSVDSPGHLDGIASVDPGDVVTGGGAPADDVDLP